MNPEIPDDKSAAIKEALYSGRKIEAIKMHRAATGSGLAEAKAAVDKLEAELRSSSPEKFAAPRSGGCLGVLILSAALLGVLAWSAARFPSWS